jgi:hypothetical protein
MAAGCAKPCAGGGCCRQSCEVACEGGSDETFGKADLLQKLIEYRDQLRVELATVQQSIAELEAGREDI